uniref:Uncharacterized protein n=1 Tax=Vespula pensylvanica TaxID=30213 RepID=A0A834P436_VESPE|nr:hypothetical protein H0235_007028 [Vespula pensylvanica]
MQYRRRLVPQLGSSVAEDCRRSVGPRKPRGPDTPSTVRPLAAVTDNDQIRKIAERPYNSALACTSVLTVGPIKNLHPRDHENLDDFRRSTAV